MDRDKLKEKIAQTIATVDGETDWDYVRSIPNHPIYGLAMEQAEAALSAIEASGYVLMPKDKIIREMSKDMTGRKAGNSRLVYNKVTRTIDTVRTTDIDVCQADASVKGETVSREGALQTSILRMGEEGQLTGAKDRHGREIRIGDTLRFDYDEWNCVARSGEQEDCIFVMGYADGQLVHPGSYSDLSAWCEIIEASSQSENEEAQRADTERPASDEVSLTHNPSPPQDKENGDV